jgi:hypothetical protein
VRGDGDESSLWPAGRNSNSTSCHLQRKILHGPLLKRYRWRGVLRPHGHLTCCAARRLWKLRLESCRLVLENRILGLEREGDRPARTRILLACARSRPSTRPHFHHNDGHRHWPA